MTTSYTLCCVMGCNSRQDRNKDVAFHKFPDKNKTFVYVVNSLGVKQKVDRYKVWMKTLSMMKHPSKSTKVCSKHFTRDDFILPGVPTQRAHLKKIAVPSVNLPGRDVISQHYKLRGNKIKRSIKLLIRPKSSGENKEAEEKQAIKVLTKQKSVQLPYIQFPSTTREQGVQCGSINTSFSFANLIKTDHELNILTGLPTDLFIRIVSKCETVTKPSFLEKISMKACVLLTFMKLRTAFSFTVLSVFFKSYSPTECRRIFLKTVPILASVLRPVIYWPSVEEVKLTIPECYENLPVRFIVDCTELRVQRAKSSRYRLATYSHSKRRHTIKYMTAVTPAGLVAFASKSYGGRYAEQAIFEHCELMRKFKMFRNEIMIDKRFLIQDMVEKYGAKVVRPFLRQRRQFSKVQDIFNRKIRQFEILRKPLAIYRWSTFDDIFTIVCSVVNLTNPVFDKLKF